MTQDDNLLPWRNTLDNVLFALEVQGRLNEETEKRAGMLIRAVGLAGFERYYPHELSGGMRKRTALIRTLVYDPPMILMDEPFGAVDAQTRTQLQDDLLKLWELGRKTIIFVTHDITEAIALGDRALVLSRQLLAHRRRAPDPGSRAPAHNVKDIFAPRRLCGDLRENPGGCAMTDSPLALDGMSEPSLAWRKWGSGLWRWPARPGRGAAVLGWEMARARLGASSRLPLEVAVALSAISRSAGRCSRTSSRRSALPSPALRSPPCLA